MIRRTSTLAASMRYQRPYWMLHLKGADNWKIYEELPKDPNHQRVEMEYQAWLGGLDRPYVRPRCMAFHPVWLEKKRHLLNKPELHAQDMTPLERYTLEWQQKFFSFRGTLRPAADDLHTAFDLVERPLDLSYAIQILHWCRNENDIHFAAESLQIFVEACLRVDRMDVAKYAVENAEPLGFWHVDPAVKAFVEGTGPDFRGAAPATSKSSSSSSDAAAAAAAGGGGASAEQKSTSAEGKVDELDDEASLAAELAALEEEERMLAAELGGKNKKNKKKK